LKSWKKKAKKKEKEKVNFFKKQSTTAVVIASRLFFFFFSPSPSLKPSNPQTPISHAISLLDGPYQADRS
jgi:hypothetical protein